jgi:hypothetical protein
VSRVWGLILLGALVLVGAAACGGGGDAGSGGGGGNTPSFDDVRAIAVELNGGCPKGESVSVEPDEGSVEKKAVQCTYEGAFTNTEQIVMYERFEDRESLQKELDHYFEITQLPYVFVDEDAKLFVRGPDAVIAVEQYDTHELATRIEEQCGCGEVRATGK